MGQVETHHHSLGVRGGKLPPAEQVWEHGCCSARALERALKPRRGVSAIETDVMFEGGAAVIRHPGGPASEMTFADFLAKVAGSRRHIKVDFKDARAVNPALSVLREMQNELRGQGVWLNADVLHGPGKRWKRSVFSPPVAPADFLELCDKELPGALWSLGWSVGRLIPFNS